MPVMDGYEATGRIREAESRCGIRRTPIIALTAHAVEEEARRTILAGDGPPPDQAHGAEDHSGSHPPRARRPGPRDDDDDAACAPTVPLHRSEIARWSQHA